MGEILVEEYRGEIVENVHRGYICGVAADGEVKYSVGDVNHITYFRSAAKPIQAVPVIEYGLDKKYNLSDKEAAIFAGSHRGEPFHIEVLESIMSKTGISEDKLVCLPTYPLDAKAREDLIRAQCPPRSIYHNCAGKHLGMLLLCKELGYSMDDYWSIDNPVQKMIRKYVSLIADYQESEVKIGTDGCGVPVFAMPLKYLANAYLRLACPDLIPDRGVRSAVTRVCKLMNEHYEMVSGSNAICSLLLMDKNIVAKGGAKGVYCFGLKNERLGFALKVEDGSSEEWPFIIASILEQIDYKNKDTIKRLYDTFPVEIKNDNGKTVGINKVKFSLIKE